MHLTACDVLVMLFSSSGGAVDSDPRVDTVAYSVGRISVSEVDVLPTRKDSVPVLVVDSAEVNDMLAFEVSWKVDGISVLDIDEASALEVEGTSILEVDLIAPGVASVELSQICGVTVFDGIDSSTDPFGATINNIGACGATD